MRGAVLRSRAALVWAALALLGLAGCTNTTAANSSVSVSGSTLTVFASQPPGGSGGPTAADLLDAERLALTQKGGKVGKFAVRLVTLDGHELSDNARTAIEDQSTIAYLGELQPGTSQISVQITNQQGVLQVSPADTAIYLTRPTPAVPGAPSEYYPARTTFHETFARVVPNSGNEAKALVQEMQASGVSKLYVANDGQAYSAAIALEVIQDARAAGLAVSTGAPTAGAVQSAGANAVFYGSSLDSPGAGRRAAAFLNGVAAASPSVKLFAPSGLSAPAQKNLSVSSPGFLTRDLTPAGQQFVSAFKAAYGHVPAPQAIFGYEAMSSLLYVLGQAGANANSRSLVVQDFRSLKDPPNSAIGSFSINGGDPSIAPFIIARVQGGQLTPVKALSG